MGSLMLDAARRELADFNTKVLPVCEYYDNHGLLYVVSLSVRGMICWSCLLLLSFFLATLVIKEYWGICVRILR